MPEPIKLSRFERGQQLRQLQMSPAGKAELQRLFFACFPPGSSPDVGAFMIETILDHEYGPEQS